LKSVLNIDLLKQFIYKAKKNLLKKEADIIFMLTKNVRKIVLSSKSRTKWDDGIDSIL